MKIQELIHLHALLLETREYLERENNVPYGTFDPYDAQPIHSSHIHRQKDAHMNAIDLLLDGLDNSVQPYPPPDNHREEIQNKQCSEKHKMDVPTNRVYGD